MRHFNVVGCVLLTLMLVGCGKDSSSTPATQPAAPPVVQVTGDEARYDLGKVAPESEHFVIFVVSNPLDRVVKISKIRGECECISAVDPPTQIDAHGTVRITAKYMAPKVTVPYESGLMLVTDDPARKLITLRVASLSVKHGL